MADTFTGFPPGGIALLAGLAAGNARTCFHANRGTYANDVAAPLRALVAAVGERLRDKALPQLLNVMPVRAASCSVQREWVYLMVVTSGRLLASREAPWARDGHITEGLTRYAATRVHGSRLLFGGCHCLDNDGMEAVPLRRVQSCRRYQPGRPALRARLAPPSGQQGSAAAAPRTGRPG